MPKLARSRQKLKGRAGFLEGGRPDLHQSPFVESIAHRKEETVGLDVSLLDEQDSIRKPLFAEFVHARLFR